MERFVVNIEGKEYVGAPTMTREEADEAFKAAAAEWPEVKRSLNRNWLCWSIWVDVGHTRAAGSGSGLELTDETEFLEWEQRHGVVGRIVGNSMLRLIAWTNEGELAGPLLPYTHWTDDIDETVSVRMTSASVDASDIAKGIVGRFKLTIDGTQYEGAPVYTSEAAEAAITAAIAEIPTLREERKAIDKISDDLTKYGDRLDVESRLNRIMSHRAHSQWLARHGIVQELFADKIYALTKDGKVERPDVAIYAK